MSAKVEACSLGTHYVDGKWVSYYKTVDTKEDTSVVTTTAEFDEDGDCVSSITCPELVVTRTVVDNWAYTNPMSGDPPSGGGTGTFNSTKVTTKTLDTNTCALGEEVITECSGSVIITNGTNNPTDFATYNFSGGWSLVDGQCVCSGTASGTDFMGESYSYQTDCPGVAGTQVLYSDTTVPAPGEASFVYTDGVVDDDFPAYPPWDDARPANFVFADGQGVLCWAEKTSTTKQKFKFRIKHKPTETCYLKLWIRKTTTVTADPSATPPRAASTTHDDTEKYTWNGTGNPCLASPNKSPEHADNLVKSADFEIAVPDTEGATVVMAIRKWSCVSGYEPDPNDPTKPNGFPCPDCEADPP